MKSKSLKKGINVKCLDCGHKEELTDLSAWSFIILKATKCQKCGVTITLDDVVD